MALKFAANLNFLFTEGSPTIVEKIKLAHRAGFRAVEIPFPNCNASDIIKAKEETGIEVALINIALAGSDDFKFGSASIPGAEESFKQHLNETIKLASVLNCKKIHIMAGTTTKGACSDGYLETYKRNLKYAASCLEKEGLIGVIEPINKYAVPFYFMNCYETAAAVLREINSGHLKLMMDIFHLQHICGNVSNTFKEMSDIIGHIQIAQVPHRHEPDTMGELDFSYIFHLIKELGYQDWIGCEYKPKTTTSEGLKWISKYGLNL